MRRGATGLDATTSRSVRVMAATMSLVLAAVAGPAAAAPEKPSYVPASAWAALNGKEQKEVVQELVKELIEVRKSHAEAVEAATKRSKTLNELIEEQIKSDAEAKESGYLAKKYAKDYAVMAAEYLASNAVKLQELAGEISAGEYDGAKTFVATTGAKAFGQLVSDYLKELKYTDTQYVWDTIVANADSLRKVFIEIARGDSAKALAVFKEEAKKKGKELGKKAVEQAINLVFSEFTKVNVGKAYVALVEAEVEAIEIAKRWMRREYVEPCLELYVKQYLFYAGESNRTAPGPFDVDSPRLMNAANRAYYASDAENFEECATTGRVAQEFREFEVVINEAGIRPETIYLPMLEAYRRHYTEPAEWFKSQVSGTRAKAEKAVEPGLGRASRDLLTVSQGFMGVVQIRLNQLAWEKLQDSQKKELEQQLAAALDKARPAWARAIELRDGIVGACKSYDSAKSAAAADLARASAAGVEASHIAFELDNLPPCAAGGDDMAAKAAQLRRDAASGRANFDRLLDDLDGQVAAACSAADGVKSAPTKEASREQLDRTTAAAEEARVSVAGAEHELDQLRQTRAASVQLAHALAGSPDAPAGTGRREKITALDQRLAKVEAQIPGIKGDFNGAMDIMRPSYRRATVLVDVLDDKLKQVVETLAPFGNAPDEMEGAAEAKRILAAARKERDEGGASCAYGLRDSWDKGDEESNLGAGRRAWSRQQVDIIPSPDTLAERIKAAIDACPADRSAVAGDPFSEIEQYLSGAEAEADRLDLARRNYEQCVQNAVVAYNEGWLKPLQVPPLVGLAEGAAKARLAELKLGAAVEPGDRATSMREAGTVQSQSPAPGGAIERGEVVTLKVFGPIDQTALAATAAKAESALRACDMAGAEALIKGLPEDYGERARLEALKDSLVKQERAAREGYAAARELYRSNDLDQALAKMREARGQAVCPKTAAAIDGAIGQIEQRLAAAAAERVGQAEAALQACRLDEAAALIRGLPEGADRARLVARYRGEAAARGGYKAGRGDYQNGAYDQALARFEEARGQALCQSTVAAIDAAIAEVRARRAEAARQVEDQAAAAVRACEMDRARTLLSSLPAGDPARGRIEAMMARESQARAVARQALEALKAKQYDTASDGLRRARGDAVCEKTIAAIDGYLGRIRERQAQEQQAVAALGREGEAALANCDIDRVRSILAQLPRESEAYRRLRALADRQNEAISYFPAARSAYDSGDYQGALNAMVQARRLAVCSKTRAIADDNIARIQNAQRAAADDERRRQEEEARRQAEAARVMGEIFSTLGGAQGGGTGGYGGGYPPSGGTTYGGSGTGGPNSLGGGTTTGGEDPRCAGLKAAGDAHAARLQAINQRYQAAARTNDRNQLQYYACELLKEQKRGADMLDHYRRQGCPLPVPYGDYQRQIDASRASNCG